MPDLDHANQGQSEVYTSDQEGHRSPWREGEISIFGILNILLRQRMLFMGVIALATAISVAVAATRATTYTSSVTFLTETSEGVGGDALVLAQEFGLSIGSPGGQRTPEFYADLITSVEVLRQTVTESYLRSPVGEEPIETNLVTYYAAEGQTDAERIEVAMELLKESIVVRPDRETSVVSFSITTSDPRLSQGVAQHIFDMVHRFDLTTRQTQAGAERRFSGERLAELTTELRDAEDSLKSFLIENRVFSNSPALQFDHDRLQRAVAMRQELVTSLAEAHESARIEEVRNTPVITVIDPPRVPAVRDPKGRLTVLVFGIIIGVTGGVFAAFMLNSMEQARRMGSADFQELSATWNQTFGRSAR